MNSSIFKDKLDEMRLQLPEVSKPGGNYRSVNIRGHIAYIAIQFPIYNGAYLYRGILGRDLTVEEGKQAMQLCALNVVAQIEKRIGWNQVAGINHLDIMMACTPDFAFMPAVADGASDLFVNLLGEKGFHSRSISVAQLPTGFCAGLTCSVTLAGAPSYSPVLKQII